MKWFERALRMLPAANRPPDDVFTLEREAVVAAPLDATFEFFSNAVNLEGLTPGRRFV